MGNYFDRLAGRTRGGIPLAQPIIPPIISAAPNWEPTSLPNQTLSETNIASSVASPVDSPHVLHESLPGHEQAILASTRAYEGATPLPEHWNTVATSMNTDPSAAESRAIRVSAITRVTPPPELPEPGPPGAEKDREVGAAPSVPPAPPILETRAAKRDFASEQALAASTTHPSVTTPARSSSPQHVHSFQAEAPVIRVTIGRVDVRAQFPPPTTSAAPVKPKRTSILSLEEYARQRREGRR